MIILKIIGKLIAGLLSLFFFILFIACSYNAILQFAYTNNVKTDHLLEIFFLIVFSGGMCLMFAFLSMIITITRSKEYYMKKFTKALEKGVTNKLSFIATFEKNARKILGETKIQ